MLLTIEQQATSFPEWLPPIILIPIIVLIFIRIKRSSKQQKKKNGCLIPFIIILIIFVGFFYVIIRMAQNSEQYHPKSVLAKELDLSTEQETKMLEIFEQCGIGDITEVSLFQEGEGHTSYHLDDEETAFYSSLDNKIIVWINDESKQIESIYFHDQDIYIDGEVIAKITDYYVNSEDRDKYRLASQLALKQLLNYPDTAKYPAISGWKFGIEEDGIIVQSNVTAKNALGVEQENIFQVTFDKDDNIISLIVDGTEYIK